MEKEIISVVKYFSFFAYQPTLEEVYTFLPIKISKKQLKYTPPQYGIRKIKDQKLKIKISQSKLNNWRFRAYIKLLSLFPQIKLVGLSGSISMMNAEENDDIDLFIITAKNRLFTGRFIALMLAQVTGLRRQFIKFDTVFFDRLTPKGPQAIVSKKVSSLLSKNKVCLNLFFDESNLKVPKFKQTEFVGHEVLQMKPIINKDQTYEGFLEANGWVFKLFPNSIKDFRGLKADFHRYQRKSAINLWQSSGDWLEFQLKKLQLKLINRHRTTEIITPFQLWFHPDDFEKKIQSRTTASVG